MFKNLLGPKVLEKYYSHFSGEVLVMQNIDRSRYIATGPLTQSGDIIKDLWKPVLKKYGEKNKSWLILGLAGGTVATQIAKNYSPIRITGIEIDPILITIGKKYFNLDTIANLEVLNLDANHYILDTKEHFDYLLVDMYVQDQIPAFVYSKQFLEKLHTISDCVIINHLFLDKNKPLAEKLINILKDIYPIVELQRSLVNIFLIATK